MRKSLHLFFSLLFHLRVLYCCVSCPVRVALMIWKQFCFATLMLSSVEVPKVATYLLDQRSASLNVRSSNISQTQLKKPVFFSGRHNIQIGGSCQAFPSSRGSMWAAPVRAGNLWIFFTYSKYKCTMCIAHACTFNTSYIL